MVPLHTDSQLFSIPRNGSNQCPVFDEESGKYTKECERETRNKFVNNNQHQQDRVGMLKMISSAGPLANNAAADVSDIIVVGVKVDIVAVNRLHWSVGFLLNGAEIGTRC